MQGLKADLVADLARPDEVEFNFRSLVCFFVLLRHGGVLDTLSWGGGSVDPLALCYTTASRHSAVLGTEGA